MSTSNKSHTKSSSSGSSLSLILGFSKSIEKGSFGVLYAMIKGNTFPKILTIISLLIEFCQLSSFGFKHQYPWGGDAGYYLKKIMSPVNHPSNLVGYNGFQILFWIVVGLMVLGFINIWYVAYQFYQGKIANIWIIRTLRWFVSTSVAVLYIPILSLLLIGLDCTSTKEFGTILRKFEEESIQCFRGANLPISIVSIILIIIFSIVAFISSATYYEYDTNVKSRFSKPHARFDVSILLVKTIFAFFNSLVDFVPWLTSITFFVLMLCLTIASIVVLPYNNQRLNQIKSGFYTVVLWISFMTMVTMGIYDETSPATSYIAIAGAFPAFPVGYFLNRFYYKWLSSQVASLQIVNESTSTMDLHEKKKGNSIDKADLPTSKITWGKEPITLGSKRQIIFPFFENKLVFSFFVEIMARKILKNSFNEGVSNSSNDAIERANNLYQCGLQYFPKSDILWMAYCNFLFTVRKDRHIGYAALEKLRRMKPSFDVRFFIYQRDKEREQLMDSDLRGPGNGGKIQDFVSYMEFKKLYYGAKRHHVKCLNYIKRFWGHLLHETVDLHRLSDLSGRIATTENKANESYERLLALNPNSVRVLRDYSQFLEEVVKDKDSALRLQKKAEAIEEIMSKSQTTDFKISDIKTLDDSDNEVEFNEPNAIQLAKIDADINEKTRSSGTRSTSSKSKDDSSDTSGSSRGRRSKYREFQQSNAINKLSWLMIATTAACIIFLIVVLIVFRGLAVKHTNAYQGILSITDCATEAVSLGMNLNAMHAYSLAGGTPGYPLESSKAEVERRRKLNDRSIVIMKNIHDAIYWGEGDPTSYVGDNLFTLKERAGYTVFDIGSVVFDYTQFNRSNLIIDDPDMVNLYNEPSVNMTILITTPGSNNTQLYSQPYNAWKAGNSFIESAIIANKLSFDNIKDGASSHPEFQFVTLNSPIVMPKIFLKIQQVYIESLVQEIMNTLNSILYVWLGIFCFLFLIAILLFRPVVTKISREKIRTLVLFSLAPRDVVIRLANRKVKMTSIDSGSERDNLFDSTDDDVSARAHDHLGEDETPVGDRKKNDDISNEGTGESSENADNSGINKSEDSIINAANNSGRRPLLDSTSILNSTQNRNTSSSAPNDRRDSTAITIPEEKKYGWDGKSKRNLNKKSLKVILRRLHWSYFLAVFLLFGFITMGIWVSFTVVFNNSQSGFTLGQSCTRALDSRIINFYVAELYTYSGDRDPKNMLSAVSEFQNNHQSLPYLEEVRPLMEGSYGCWLLNKTQCLPSTSPYYEDISQGMDWVIDQFTKNVINLVHTDDSELPSSPDLEWVLEVGSDQLYQGLDLATFTYFEYYRDKQEWATMVLTTILAITSVILLIVYVVLFRPFMNHLRIQHIHTLALLRLAPEDIRYMEVSDKVIDED
ncbi:hypothetical protein DICPUDRAFT_42369 [Dictyostelium purpureum]|uniref:TmcB/TmcC TPR repeats domain-containing protein n=1 Tax=Dictyostelium purpureum TaxID=5786 RepID=F1A1W8_DICPU|nr:uncharacterized protein DICPUDRAFT_42369 [Dictyostelium purpureum]EGC29813.1 hypothetical protein DICPUDRAFT_42369 [Dictyostelium purpureum]|eukprot:XP_003293661.1 hypothetical protein DICPUDRAFT_42369 [Dictyostelium purpureum]